MGLMPEAEPTTAKFESVIAYWGFEAIHQSYDRLIAHGATAYEKPTNVGGELMTASVKDPYGNLIGLIYNPYFKLTGK